VYLIHFTSITNLVNQLIQIILVGADVLCECGLYRYIYLALYNLHHSVLK